MKQNILLLFLIALFTNCENTNNQKKQIKDIIDYNLTSFNIPADVKVVENKEFELGDVIISFRKPYRLTGKEIKDILIQYMAYDVFKKLEIKGKLRFQYYLEDEMNIEVLVTTINDQQMKNAPFQKETYVKLLEYCFKNFERGDDIGLILNLEVISKLFPQIVQNDKFFKILYEFSLNKEPNIDFNADRIIILFHSYNLFLIEDNLETEISRINERKLEIKHLAEFWRIAKDTDINEEEDFLEEVKTFSQQNDIRNKKKQIPFLDLS